MNGVQSWFSGLKFIWLISDLNLRIAHHLEVFLKFPIHCITQNHLKENFSETQFVNGVQPWFSGLKFILAWPISAQTPGLYTIWKYFKIF